MSLRDWVRNGWLTEHESSPQEIQDLLAVAERDLTDSQVSGVSADWRLNIAYNAVLQLATVALAAAGYRAAREAHHYRVIQSLGFTLEVDSDLIAQLDQFRKKRNIAEYETAGTVSDQEAREMGELAIHLRARVVEWLEANHPELIGGG